MARGSDRKRRFAAAHGWVALCLAGLVVRQLRFADRVDLVDFDSRFDAALAFRALELQSRLPGLRNEFLTGLGNLQWGNLRWLDPISLAGVWGPGVYSMAWAATAGVLVAFLGTRWLARCFDATGATASLAGLLAAGMAIGPGVLPVVLPDQFRIVPSFPAIAASAAVVLGSLERVGATSGRTRVAHGAAVASGASYLAVVHTHYLVLPAFVCVVGAVAILGHRVAVRAPVRAQLVLLGGLAAAWWASGVLRYVRGFLSYVAAVEHGERFSWTFAPFGRAVTLPVRTWFPQATSDLLRLTMALLAVGGIVAGARRPRSRDGRGAILAAAVLVAVLAYRVSQRWWPHELGPTSDYLAWTAIPLVAVAVAVALVRLAALAPAAARRVSPRAGAMALAAAVAALVAGVAPRMEPPVVPFPDAPGGGWRPIVDATSLDRDAAFRGRTAVFARVDDAGAVTLGRAVPFDQTLRWGVPVLNEHSHLQTPASFDFFARFLFRDGDGQVRNHPGLRRVDGRILALLGVRYLVTDGAGPHGAYVPVAGAAPIATPNGAMRLYETARYNDGSYSPTLVVQTTSRAATLDAIADPTLDLTTTAVSEDRSLAGVALVAARDVRLAYDRGDLRLSATSAGESLLVLPLEYSQCLRVRSAGAEVPSLHRVDGVLTGVRFSGVLDARIAFRFSPGPSSGCRLRDLADDRVASS